MTLRLLIRTIASVLLVIATSCTSTPTVSPSPAFPSLALTSTAASTSVAATPTAVLTPPGADRYGLVIGASVRSEGDPRRVAELAAVPSSGAVSPDGKRLAYWEALPGGGEARVLRLFDIATPAQERILATLPASETADVSTGGGVTWSSDGSGLLIGVRSVAYVSTAVPVGAERPVYSALRDVDVASGAVHEVARLLASLPLRPVAWDRRSRVGAAVGIGDGGYTGTYVVARDGAQPTTTPMCCNIAPALGAPDATRALAVSSEPKALFIWPLADPDQRTTMGAAAGERIDRAIWRNAHEIVVLIGGDAPSSSRLEVWSLDGPRRVVLMGARELAAIRADGSAAIVSGEVVDLDTGARWPIPGLAGQGRVVATLLLR